MNAGVFITSTPLLDDSVFEDVTVFITEYNHKGAIGFVINKPFGRNLNELEEFNKSIAFPLYDGGPVDREHLYMVHRRPDLIPDGTLITGNLHMGGNFAAALQHLNAGTIAGKDIKLFIGYCGWDNGELDAEIAEGSWNIIENGNPFSQP
jgi:putative transcriptional regulator